MITQCNFCDYSKETPAPKNLLAISASPNQPQEDQELWQRRLVITMGTADYSSVKIHMGRMHKGLARKGEQPKQIWTEEEVKIVNEAIYGKV